MNLIKIDRPPIKSFVDLTNKTIGRLTVKELAGYYAPPCGKRRYFWRTICECGKESNKAHMELLRGETTSCGCAAIESVRARSIKHLSVGTPEYNSWAGMKDRCLNKNHHAFANYGGRGIKICDRWRDSFLNFKADMGTRPVGTTIDRINNDGNYEPGNCRWASRSVQAKNKRQSIRRAYGTFSKRRAVQQ